LHHAHLVKVWQGLHRQSDVGRNNQPGRALGGSVGLAPVDFHRRRILVGNIRIGLCRELELVTGDIDRLNVATGVFDRERNLARESGSLFDAEIQARLTGTWRCRR